MKHYRSIAQLWCGRYKDEGLLFASIVRLEGGAALETLPVRNPKVATLKEAWEYADPNSTAWSLVWVFDLNEPFHEQYDALLKKLEKEKEEVAT